MRVAIIGQAAFGEAVLNRLRERGVEIAGISAPRPSENAKPDPLWAAAQGAGLPVVPTGDLKSHDGLEAWGSLRADLCVMAFVTEILPNEVFAAPRLGTIQYHPSLLPLHRGISSMNWPIIFGEPETGLTIFWPDEGIDTGPILLQKRCPIGSDDTVGSIYFEQLFPMGVDAMAEAVEMVARGEAPRIEQNHAVATYEPPCTEQHAQIQWHEPSERVYARIRGCNPQPGAWTMHENKKLKIFDAQLSLDPEPGMPGKVLGIREDGIDVRLNGGVLRIGRVQPQDGKKMSAAEWAQSAGIDESYRFR